MSDKNINISMKITDEIIEEYYSKMNVLKQKNIIIKLTVMLVLITISYDMKETDYRLLFNNS